MSENTINIPKHIGIIVDGNGRWGLDKGKGRSYGHTKGADNLERIARYAISKGVSVLSFFVFSTENFKRDKEEVDHLMKLLVDGLKQKGKTLSKENIKLLVSGRREPLSNEILMSIDDIIETTKDNSGGVVNFCLNYGGRSEIVDAVKKIYEDIKTKKLNIDELDEESFNKYLYHDLPPIDFVIRTSGEHRISNFMLYQLSYAELYFPECYFPDFDESEFDKAIEVYNNRNRRFGGTNK